MTNLKDRIAKATLNIRNGIAAMHYPPRDHDADLVLDECLERINDLEEKLAQYQRDDYMLVPKDQIEVFWQDDDEPENLCSLESDLDCLGESYDVGDIMVINKTSSAHIKTEKLYGVSVPCKAVSILSRKSKLVLFDNYDDAHRAMIEAQEKSGE